MSADDFVEISKIARASLMPDFFAVRIEEEGLFERLKEMVAKIKMETASWGQIQQIAQASTTPMDFIDAIKARNLWNHAREVLTKVKFK